MKYKILIAVAAVALMSSCKSNNTSLTYFEDIAGIEAGALALSPNVITVKPGDELLITINSASPETTSEYNVPLVNPATSGSLKVTSQPQVQTFIVDSRGDISLPALGTMHVEGLTTEQITEKVLAMVSKQVSNPFVRVELLNFTVKVLGEVEKPGTVEKPVGAQYITVLDALALSGDINEYSDRTKVMVLRNENGKMTYHRLNLNDSESIESPYFFLEQQDVVIVPPSKSRESNARYDTNNSFKVQVVSTIVSAVSVIASLVIALAVK